MRDGNERLELERLVRSSAWLVGVLTAVRETGLPDAMVGAGVLRDLVWGELHGGFDPDEVKESSLAGS